MLHVLSNEKVKKTMATATLAVFAAAGAVMPAFAADTEKLILKMTIGETAYQVNEVNRTMDSAPYIDENDRTMVPVRFVGEALEADVTWNADDQTVTVKDGDNAVVFTIGSNDMTVNGEVKTIDTAAVIKDDRTMLPLRAAAESIGAEVAYDNGVITISKEVAAAPAEVTVANYQELTKAVAGRSAAVTLAKDFSTEGEAVSKLVVERPVVLNGNNVAVDFGIEIKSGDVTVKNFVMDITDFNRAVSTGGNTNLKNPGDSVAIEVHNDSDKPVVITNNSVKIDVFGASNSAIYLADKTYAEVTDNVIVLENKENNNFERGGVFIGAGVSGEIANNDITSSKTALPMTPIGMATNLDTLTAGVTVPSVNIHDNNLKTRYVTKMYASGQLFGEDNLLLESDSDFGARKALSAFVVAMAENNTYEIVAPYPVENEDAFVQCRLDKIMAGGTYFENNVFFHVEDGKMVRIPAPVVEAE